MKKDSINIRMKNNSNVRVPVQILGGNNSTNQNSNKNDLVSWDLTSENFDQNVLILTTTPAFSAVLSDNEQNVSGVVDKLNSFGVATFFNENKIIYATNILNETVQTALIDIDNTAFDISGWINLVSDDGQDNYVGQLINAQFSNDGLFIFMGDSDFSRQDRFTVSNAFVPADINLIDQTENAFNLFSWFGNNGLFRYTKSDGSSTWNRQPLGTAYDLTTLGAIDQTGVFNAGNWIHWNEDGSMVYGIIGATIFQYTPVSNWSLSIASTSSYAITTLLPVDALTLSGVLVSPDGSRGFIFKQTIGSTPIAGRIYQVDLSTPFDFSSSIYKGVFIELNNLNINQPFIDIQFQSNGKRLITSQDDGLGAQLFQQYG